MKTIWKILTGAAVLTAGGPAFAENQPLTCWYNDHADFTSADSAAADATVGAVTKYGSGDKTYNYTILARDGTACPVQLPLSTLTAVTVALVRQDDDSCTNENVVDSGSAVVAGSVTVARAYRKVLHRRHTPCWPSPQHELPHSIEMRPPARNRSNRRLRQRRANGRLSKERREDVYSFEISPEGDPTGAQSCRACL